MARFADLIGTISEPSPAPIVTEPIPQPSPGATHADVTAALAAIAAPGGPNPIEPDPADALSAAFGTAIPEPLEFDATINDDLLPSRPAKGRRR
jgi:hypothetical protein